ncbi:MAG: hypothetical protein JWR75_1694 [Devosia sp.]|nr:hypothetical protein [Devosia sp.]
MRSLLAILPLLLAPLPVSAFELQLPLDCAMNETCFFQQFPDMDDTAGVADPWCGGASYEGHDGTDIRLRSLPDIALGVPVVAAADGTVVGLRDGVPDHLVVTDADRAAIADIECGNGVLLKHEDGWETQYCHMREGSIAVAEGDAVKTGDKLGEIGASGLVQFPHLHLSVRHNGVDIDPTSGRAVGDACGMSPGGGGDGPLWSTAAIQSFRWDGQVLDMGLAGDVIDHASLTSAGAPPSATTASDNFIGWAWFSNLHAGDIVALRLETAAGELIAENTSEPLDANKADYSAYAGKRGAPKPGDYRLTASVIRDGVPTITETRSITVE